MSAMGEQLPQTLAGRGQPIDKSERIGAEVAHAMRAWQGGDVQEHTGGTLV